jgi:hypothetical protein
MNEKNPTTTSIKFSAEELSELKKIQTDYQQTIIRFGELNIERLSIESSINNLKIAEDKLKQEYSDLQKKEQSLINKIIDKYGEGTLNIAEGVFTPEPKK